MKVILIRHGETAWNLDVRFRGRCDIALSENGVEQSYRTAKLLSNLHPTAILSGPLKRCLQTAAPLVEQTRMEIQIEEGLNDVDFGAWSGLRPEEVKQKWPREYDRWRSGDLTLRFPEGESLKDGMERISDFIVNLERRFNQDSTLICVTHQVPLKLLTCWLVGSNDAFWRVHFEPTSITILRRTPRSWQIVTLGSFFHTTKIS